MIPKHFYFIYLYGPETYEFNYYHFVSLVSNIEINKPEKVTIVTNDYNRLVRQPYMDVALRKYSCIKVITLYELAELIPGLDIENYKGNHIPYMSHQADILKNELIRNFGGIYSDFDSVALKPIPDEWYNSDKSIFCSEDNETGMVGICAGFFLGVKECPFITANLNRYADYDENEVKPKTPNWAKFAVQLPLETYKNNPDWIKLVPAYYFEPIYTYYDHVDTLFFKDKDSMSPVIKELVDSAYQLHLWENRNGYILRTYGVNSIIADSNRKFYASIMTPYLVYETKKFTK